MVVLSFLLLRMSPSPIAPLTTATTLSLTLSSLLLLQGVLFISNTVLLSPTVLSFAVVSMHQKKDMVGVFMHSMVLLLTSLAVHSEVVL